MIYHHSFGNHGLMKKIFSVCIIFALVLSISIPTFAEDAGNSSESNSAQQPAQGITENTSANAEGNDSQLTDEQGAGQGKDVSGELTSEAGVQDDGNGDADVYAGDSTRSYNLYTYTLIPGKSADSTGNPDQTWNGMGVYSISGVTAPSQQTVGTIIDDGYGSSGAQMSLPNTYPDITYGNVTYKYATTTEQESQEGYYTITWFRVIASDGANAGNNGYNSTVNSGTTTYHLDGYITLNEKSIFTVDFKLKDAGKDSFEPVNPETYTQRVDQGTEASKLKIPTEKEPSVYPQTKIDSNGIQYRFDGWYLDESCTQRADFSTMTIESNTTFYGKYVPIMTSVTITKKVTGGLGDRTKTFGFTYRINNGESVNFSLIHDGRQTINNIPVGSKITISEIDYSDQGYTTSYSVNNGQAVAGNTVEITVTEGTNQVEFINNKDVTPDTGLHLTSLPYIMMLALAAGGAVVFFMRRRHRI